MFRTAMTACAVLTLATSFLPPTSSAQAPAAIVEDVNSRSAGVEFMEYLPAGKSVRLNQGDTLVLGYLKSCWRESIAGGVVAVGQEQSQVSNGKVTRTKEQCDAGNMQLSAEEAKKSGAMAFRRGPAKQSAAELTIYGRVPVFDVQRPGTLVIERLDQQAPRISVEVTADRLLRGTFFDLAKMNTALAPGARYRAEHDGRQIVFRISPEAPPGAGPVIARLVRLPAQR